MRVVETPLLLCASTKGTDVAKCFLVGWLRRKTQLERIYLCVRELAELRVVVIGREIFNGEMSILYRDKLSPHPNVMDVTYASFARFKGCSGLSINLGVAWRHGSAR